MFFRRTCLCALLLASSCSSELSSPATDGNPVLTFAGAVPGSTITFLVNSHASQAGIKGLTLDIATTSRASVADQLTLDDAGNLGVRGHVFSNFEYTAQKDPAHNGDALTALSRARFDITSSGSDARIAFYGPQPSYISSEGALDLSSSLVFTMAAVKQLSQEVTLLREEVRSLRSQRNIH